jgi:hypothetical protein
MRQQLARARLGQIRQQLQVFVVIEFSTFLNERPVAFSR